MLEAAGLPVDFLPTRADGKTLAAELPADLSAGSVLFPVSALAADTIVDGLKARGIRVRRINTYETVPAEWTPAELELALSAQIVTFGSPSAVRVWSERVGTAAVAVRIGETTAVEARERALCKSSHPRVLEPTLGPLAVCAARSFCESPFAYEAQYLPHMHFDLRPVARPHRLGLQTPGAVVRLYSQHRPPRSSSRPRYRTSNQKTIPVLRVLYAFHNEHTREQKSHPSRR